MGNRVGQRLVSNPNFTRLDLISGIKEKQFKNIILFSGAGMSVAAGLPDFRSPGTGLYSKIQQYGLPYPEALFHLDYFKKDPKPFYSFAKAYIDVLKAKPVLAHHFVKMLHDENLLYRSFTQNVDGLELLAGLPPGKLIEAHGHLRSVSCIDCRTTSTLEDFKKVLEEVEVVNCKDCKGLLKPDVTFFGESLPLSFYLNTWRIKKADLAIVIGTSLRVQPFAGLIEMVPKDVPMVLINRENPHASRDKLLWMGGNIEDNVKDLIKDLDWGHKIPKTHS